MDRPPRPGDLLEVGPAASVQFAEPFLFRVIRVHEWTTTAGWLWVDGYQLTILGTARERRSIFVMPAGLMLVAEREKPTPISEGTGRQVRSA